MTDDHRIPPFAVAEARDLLVEIFEELDWGFEHGDYNAADALIRRIYSRGYQIIPRPPVVMEEVVDHDLFAEIAERRKDPEFQAQLDRIMREEKDILDRLADED